MNLQDKERSPRKEKKKKKKPKYDHVIYCKDHIALLDAQGRHRSEWCYAAYDGRKETPLPNGQSTK